MIETRAWTVSFDEFARLCDLVEQYFGETVDEVAVHAPVSKRQLVAVLARAQIAGHDLTASGRLERSDIVYQSSRETLCWLETAFWDELRESHNLSSTECLAACNVHRRIIEAVDSRSMADDHSRDPFVFIEHPIET
ncbi:hypothetical protein D8Y22_10275 [Salinadaptatus halalkaliphilus]|uniref:DUF8048 domain-containing protein n=1 Tax=Salinadaptatus halalkaliphilus TaxID=2419781 RepID=A0A4S3TLF1_9EURY|nr:hypothetical protein [Salinadaptatus halalkaliphilus]THE64989.1 hypothetical protein D8Y22_10275 [Salinadaptatus halalkaliphilus]